MCDVAFSRYASLAVCNFVFILWPRLLYTHHLPYLVDGHVAQNSSRSSDGERCPRVVLIKTVDSGAHGFCVYVPVVRFDQA